MTGADALAAVEAAARAATEHGIGAVMAAAAEAESKAVATGPHEYRARFEAAVEDMVAEVAKQAFGEIPERLQRSQRYLMREARAHFRAAQLLMQAAIVPPVRHNNAGKWLPNEVGAGWLDEAGLWRGLERAFHIADSDRELAGPASVADLESLAHVRKHAAGLATALAVLNDPARKRAAASLLYHLPKPDVATPKPAYPDGRHEDATLRANAEQAARWSGLHRMQREAKEFADAAHRGVIRSDEPKPQAQLKLLRGLRDLFERFTGRPAAFTPKTATQQRSEFIRFVQVAYEVFGLPSPGDAGLVKLAADLDNVR